MNKVYLVISEICNDYDTDKNIYVYKDYKSAMFNFCRIIKEIKSNNANCDTIEDEENYYCEYNEGYYNDYHAVVYIEEKEVL